MLDADDSAMLNPLSSVNLAQMASVLLRWQHVSVYKAKTVYSSLSSLLQKIRRAVVSCREKLLLSSACATADDVIEGDDDDGDVAAGDMSTSMSRSMNLLGADTCGVAGSEKTSGEVDADTDSTEKATHVTAGMSSTNADVSTDERRTDMTQNSLKVDNEAQKSKVEDGKDKEEREDSSALQMLIQMSCLISSLLGQAACALIEGNVNTTVSAIVRYHAKMCLSSR